MRCPKCEKGKLVYKTQMLDKDNIMRNLGKCDNPVCGYVGCMDEPEGKPKTASNIYV